MAHPAFQLDSLDEYEFTKLGGLASVGQPEDDGVADLFVQNGWRCDFT